MIYNTFICASIAGIVEVITSHPFDVVKTKLQQNTFPKNRKGILDLKMYYRGFIPRILGVIPMRGVYWTSQHYYNLHLNGLEVFPEKSRYLISGVLAGATQTLVDSPVEYIKIMAINQSKANFFSSYRALYYGFWFNLYRNSIFAATVNFSIYYPEKYQPYYPAIGGLVGSIVSQPLDYLKTHQQAGNIKGFRDFCKNFKKHQKYIMRGTLPRATLGFINMGIGGTVFYYLTDYLKKTTE